MDVSSSSVSKLIDLLPLIIISVIVLVGFFTWEIFTKHLETFILLLTSILFAIWLYSGDIYSYLGWKKASETGTDQFFPGPGAKLELSTMIMTIIIVGIVFILGVGLALGITSYQIGNKIGSVSQHDNILSYVGYGFIGVGGITLLSLLWKAFRGKSTDDSSTTSTFGSTTFKIISSVLLSVAGIYLIARFSELGVNIGLGVNVKGQVNDSSTEEANSLSIANTVLNVGLVLQVVALLVTVYMMYRYNWFHPDSNMSPVSAYSGRFGPFVVTLVAGIIFIAAQQKWIKSDDGIESGDDKNNMYAAHGIVYMVIAGITLLIALGKLSTFNIFKILGLISAVGIIAVIIWNFVSLNNQSNFNLEENDAKNGDSYYNQVKDEVTKELKKSGNPDDVSETNIKAKIKERIDSLNNSNDKPIRDVNNALLSLSLLITIIIGLLYAAKMKIVECSKLPAKIKNIFKGDCDNDADFKESKVLNDILKGDPANIEKMNADDWVKVLEKYQSTLDPSDDFSAFAVHLAKGSRWIPFLTIILVILCVSILFSKVTTSEATLDWIARSFRGDMFPKVKELLDTFFIVFIVGLVLCSILLLPMVREQNVPGLEVITKFVDSIQVWQYKENTKPEGKNFAAAIVGCLAVAAIGLSWWWKYLNETRNGDSSLPIVPENWGWLIGIVIVFAVCCIPAFFHVVGGKPHTEFQNDNFIVRGLRLIFTSVYLVPLFLISIFKLALYFIPFFIGGLFEKPEWGTSFMTEKSKWDFTKWKAATNETTERGTDLRLFGLGKIPIPKDVISEKSADAATAGAGAVAAGAAGVPVAGAAGAAAATATGNGVAATPESLTAETQQESKDQTKVNAVGKLIKVIFIVIAFVVMILVIIYSVYKISAENKQPGADPSNYEDFTKNFNSPAAYTIYAVIGIVGIAGIVAYLREKFKATNSKNPEDYLFNDFKPEDSNSPMRQLTFGMTHIIYIVLMIVVWIYDTEKDDKDLMSVTGMTVLGILILFFHYILEIFDNKLPPELNAPADDKPRLAPMSNLLSNIRFIVNTVFFIVLCVLAYYKQHGVMVALIVVMFIFHLTKSILGIKLLKFLWACIIYIPCLLLDLIKSLQGSVGDTTRTIWIIVAIEVLLIAILYGGPYLLNYIGASASQMVAAPISIKQKYNTKLNTQSKEIFIFHNTGIDRTEADKAANCPPEEKKRYHYAISGWFFLNNNVTTKSTDLEIFNFGDVPKMTYNVSKNELKIYCDILSTIDRGLNPADRGSTNREIYNSRKNYNAIVTAEKGSEEKKANVQMSLEGEELDADIPLQRWNYFVINYDGKNMDFFLNNKLIFKSDFIMPDIQLKPITIGDTTDNKGLNGSICNFAFHKYPLTKEQIRWTYTMLKSQDPPMIGGIPTVKDEVKATGKTTVYSL
jgi:hypothetical protein